MLVIGWLLKWGVDNKLQPKIKFDNAVLQADIKKLVSELADAITRNYWLFGGIYTAVGLAAILTPRFLNKSASVESSNKIPTDAGDKTEAPKSAKPSVYKSSPAAKAPDPKARKIQG
jgi:hypothetical protein